MSEKNNEGGFYRLVHEMSIPNRWRLRFPLSYEARHLASNLLKRQPMPEADLVTLDLTGPGDPLDFSNPSDADVGILSDAAARFFHATVPNEIQLFPIAIEDISERYFALNVTSLVDCVDWERSTTIRDGKGGRSLCDVVIDSARVRGHRIFRINVVSTIVTEEFRLLAMNSGLIGMQFMPIKSS